MRAEPLAGAAASVGIQIPPKYPQPQARAVESRDAGNVTPIAKQSAQHNTMWLLKAPLADGARGWGSGCPKKAVQPSPQNQAIKGTRVITKVTLTNATRVETATLAVTKSSAFWYRCENKNTFAPIGNEAATTSTVSDMPRRPQA